MLLIISPGCSALSALPLEPSPSSSPIVSALRRSVIDRRFIGQQRRRHGRGMRRHAGAEIEGDADRDDCPIAAGQSRSALLQAGDMRIAKIPAARTLREIAAERREVTDLRRRQALRGCGNARIGRGDARVGGDGGDGREGADAQLRRPRPSASRSCRAPAAISISGPVETPLRRRSERSVPAARNSAACVAVMAAALMRRPSL